MNLRRKQQEDAELSTESLNDIMFFLLLFFLIISTMANPNVIKLMLPKSANNEQLQKQQVNLGVTKDKQYTINKVPVPFDQVVPFGGSLHCNTLDIYRESDLADYFPNQ